MVRVCKVVDSVVVLSDKNWLWGIRGDVGWDGIECVDIALIQFDTRHQ